MLSRAVATKLASLAAGIIVTSPAWAQLPPIPIQCATILVSGQDSATTWATKFSANKTTDLVFSVLFPKAFKGDHLLELRFLTPGGNLYRSMAVPVASSDKVAGERAVPGYPRPLPEKVPSPMTYNKTSYLKVAIALPVGGTDIVTNSLYGWWKVEARLDGDTSPCSAPVSFAVGQ